MLYELSTFCDSRLKREVFQYTRLDPFGERIILEDNNLYRLKKSVNEAGLKWPKSWEKYNPEDLEERTLIHGE